MSIGGYKPDNSLFELKGIRILTFFTVFYVILILVSNIQLNNYNAISYNSVVNYNPSNYITNVNNITCTGAFCYIYKPLYPIINSVTGFFTSAWSFLQFIFNDLFVKPEQLVSMAISSVFSSIFPSYVITLVSDAIISLLALVSLITVLDIITRVV